MAIRPPARRRGFFEVRWRQFRNAPRPVVRAVLSPLVVAIGLGLLYLAYDVALTRGVALPGGDLRAFALVVFIGLVLAVGTIVTWLIVPQPGPPDGGRRRSGWSAALGFFAAVPIAYLILVVEGQVLLPLLT